MNTLSKAQVLALFLGTSSASTLTAIQLLNGPSSADTVPTDQTLTTAMSGTVCSGNADCATDGEKCAAFQETGKTAQNLCIAEAYCGSVGRLNGITWFAPCWATPAEGETATAPAVADADKYWTDIAELIVELEVYPFKVGKVVDGPEEPNVWISPRFNYQDGWHIENADGKFVETDKPTDNRCFLDVQCPGTCCAYWPDSNNRRCLPSMEMNKNPVTVGPVTFSPLCFNLEAEGGEEVAPENAGDDIAKGALTEAAEAIGKFYETQLADAKTNAGYDDLTAEEKEAFDNAQTAVANKRKELFTELKASVGYDTEACNNDCKALFETELLAWGKTVYETCKTDEKSIACRQAFDIKKDEATARKGGDGKKNYYSEMTAEERSEFVKARKDQVSALESSLAAAWLKDHAPAEGKPGSSCAGELKCTAMEHCCGKSTRKDGAFVNEPLEDICVDKSTLLFTDDLGREYTHVCAAQKIMATAAAALVAAYSLM